MFGDKLAASFTAVTVPSARLMLGYGVCFIAVLIAGAIVSFLMRKLIAGSGLSGSDRMFGMLFGLLRGLVLITLAVLILQFTPFPRDPWWRQSQLLPTFENGARWLSAQLPEEAKKYLDWHQVVPQIPSPAGSKPAPPPAPDTSKKSSTT
jgi:membrane protein required for colicin V production